MHVVRMCVHVKKIYECEKKRFGISWNEMASHMQKKN